MIIKQPETMYFVSLFQEIIYHVREDKVKTFPQEKQTIISSVEQLVTETLDKYTIDDSLIASALSILSRISAVVNLDRYAHFNLLITRANKIAHYLLKVNEEKSEPSDNRMELLVAYLKYRQIITEPQELAKGNGVHIADAYRKGFLNLTEAVDAFTAQLACKHRLQFIQLNHHFHPQMA
ncbi:acyltransferase [Vibrio sp. CAU 1672]|uniref:acyltransferase n=1 Tax=Vibrio sp. CAU 1672 TaxID=3032594 RepID=UPI0023DA8BCD|nr:acyltransferase [Vibrio sp. CAU 1672]MDF2154604.1 acyltransferase [Vibrio sp. CAU 1672]